MGSERLYFALAFLVLPLLDYAVWLWDMACRYCARGTQAPGSPEPETPRLRRAPPCRVEPRPPTRARSGAESRLPCAEAPRRGSQAAVTPEARGCDTRRTSRGTVLEARTRSGSKRRVEGAGTSTRRRPSLGAARDVTLRCAYSCRRAASCQASSVLIAHLLHRILARCGRSKGEISKY